MSSHEQFSCVTIVCIIVTRFSRAESRGIGVGGEIVFDIEYGDDTKLVSRAEEKIEKEEEGGRLVLNLHRPCTAMTAPPLAECVYQYPEKKQVNALLSNMMNELTKVLIRADDFICQNKRKLKKGRFKVVDTKKTEFFEDIFNNMTKEYRKLIRDSTNKTINKEDPCLHQQEIKQMWEELLDSSQNTLKRAAKKCFGQYLRTQDKAHDFKAKAKLKKFLGKELKKIRSEHLNTLCDKFQLCYHELLEEVSSSKFKKRKNKQL